jgi:hypothetical protein
MRAPRAKNCWSASCPLRDLNCRPRCGYSGHPEGIRPLEQNCWRYWCFSLHTVLGGLGQHRGNSSGGGCDVTALGKLRRNLLPRDSQRAAQRSHELMLAGDEPDFGCDLDLKFGMPGQDDFGSHDDRLVAVAMPDTPTSPTGAGAVR